MDKNTLSNYGWILVSVMLMGVLMTFATPYGKYTMNNINYFVNGVIESAFDNSEKPALDTPELSMNGSVLTIEPVEGATSYDVYIGNRFLVNLEGNTSIDLGEHITNPGIYVIKVMAVSDNGSSKMAAVGYRLESTS